MRFRWRPALCAALSLAAAALAAAGSIGAEKPQETRMTAREITLDSAASIRLPSGTVAVNSADLYELTELPRVGETIGQAILDQREACGPYYYPEDLLAVRGIGAKTLAGFRDLLDLSVNSETE